MISALSWIPRGVAKSVPQEAAITEEEIAAAKSAAEGITLPHKQLQNAACFTSPISSHGKAMPKAARQVIIRTGSEALSSSQ